VRRPHSRFAGEFELAFRHALLREGAYAMLTEADRVLGHRLAGEWLEKMGETDPLVLAKHFDEGRSRAAAARRYVEAAKRAVAGMDLGVAIDLAARARALDPGSAVAGDCDLALAEAHVWRSDWRAVQRHSAELLRTARPGTERWVRATGLKQSAAFGLGDIPALRESIGALMTVEPDEAARPAAILAFGVAVFVLCLGAQGGVVRAVLPRLDALVAAVPERHLVPLGWASVAHGVTAAWMDGDPWTGTRHLEAACALFDEAGDRANGGFFRGLLGLANLELGAVAAAEQELGRIAAGGEPGSLVASTRRDLGVSLALARGRDDEVRAVSADLLAAANSGGLMEIMRAGRARSWLGELAERAGDLEAAEREHTAAVAMLQRTPTLWPSAAATLARVQVRRGRTEEALTTAREAASVLDVQDVTGLGAAALGLAIAEALLARGERAEAEKVLERWKERILGVAGRIPDEAIRAGYLGQAAHARILALTMTGTRGAP
jgi:tetratricopeptide (TPR) repeat protein